MVPPNKKTNTGNSQAGIGNRLVAENMFAGENRNHLGNNPHAGKDHDVDRRVGIKPKEMLEQNGVSPQCRIKNADLQNPLHDQQQRGNADHRRCQHLNDGGGINVSDKKRHSVKRHPRTAEFVNRHDKIEPCQNGGKPHDKDTEGYQDNARAGANAVGCVKGPAGVGPAGE